MGYPVKQSQTAQPLLFLMIDSSNHISGKPGLSPTVTLSKNGGAFASPAGTVTEIANGWYKVAGNATDEATLGPLLLHATGAGADDCDDRYDVVAYDPQSATAFVTSVGVSGAFSATMLTSLNAATPAVTVSDKTGFSLSAAGVQAIWDALTSALTTVGSIGKLIVTNLDAAISSRLATGTVATDITAIGTKTTNLPASPAAVGSAMTLTSGERTSIADAHLDRADAIETGLTPRQAYRIMTAALAGVLSGAATATVVVKNAVANTKTRITVTADVDGNRSVIITDLT